MAAVFRCVPVTPIRVDIARAASPVLAWMPPTAATDACTEAAGKAGTPARATPADHISQSPASPRSLEGTTFSKLIASVYVSCKHLVYAKFEAVDAAIKPAQHRTGRHRRRGRPLRFICSRYLPVMAKSRRLQKDLERAARKRAGTSDPVNEALPTRENVGTTGRLRPQTKGTARIVGGGLSNGPISEHTSAAASTI